LDLSKSLQDDDFGSKTVQNVDSGSKTGGGERLGDPCEGNPKPNNFLLPRPHVEKMLLRSYFGLFPLEVECDDDSSDDELASAKEWWAADFVDAFQLCPEVERDDFVNSWAEPLVYGCFPEMCQNLFFMSECERESSRREGATDLLGRLSEAVQPLWDDARCDKW